MKVILHNLDVQYNGILSVKCDKVIHADGKYAPCQGCFGCWTKHPAAPLTKGNFLAKNIRALWFRHLYSLFLLTYFSPSFQSLRVEF